MWSYTQMWQVTEQFTSSVAWWTVQRRQTLHIRKSRLAYRVLKVHIQLGCCEKNFRVVFRKAVAIVPDNQWRLWPLNGYWHRIGGNITTNWLLTPISSTLSHEVAIDTKGGWVTWSCECYTLGHGHMRRLWTRLHQLPVLWEVSCFQWVASIPCTYYKRRR